MKRDKKWLLKCQMDNIDKKWLSVISKSTKSVITRQWVMGGMIFSLYVIPFR